MIRCSKAIFAAQASTLRQSQQFIFKSKAPIIPEHPRAAAAHRVLLFARCFRKHRLSTFLQNSIVGAIPFCMYSVHSYTVIDDERAESPRITSEALI